MTLVVVMDEDAELLISAAAWMDEFVAAWTVLELLIEGEEDNESY